MKRRFLGLLARMWRFLTKPDVVEENRSLRRAIERIADRPRDDGREEYIERVGELIEARAMAGAGPWRIAPDTVAETDRLITASVQRLRSGVPLRESTPALAQGAYGDIELALQNVEWRREINLSWLEFTRWGIQQIILISRLYYVKNPLIQRGVNVASYYVFGRGVEVSCTDDDANDVLKECWDRNSSVLGQTALSELQKRLYYDGNVFFVLFTDRDHSGKTTVRTIDTTEINDIVCNPDDTDEPWYYKRCWTANVFDPKPGTSTRTKSQEAWYPALGYDPPEKPAKLGEIDVKWESPIIHMKGGTGVSKWHFDVPKVYAALDWAREARRFLEACASVKQALKQIAMTLTTKGGQQALAGAKQQLSTTVGPDGDLWDQNPPTVPGGIFASGPGTTLQAFNTKGGGGDPDEVRQFKLMVAMTLDIPESFLADMNTSNLATALALDRPTELGFIEKQERWREVLVKIGTYVIEASGNAPSGQLREALTARGNKDKVVCIEARRVMKPDGRYVYEASKKKNDKLEVKATFPAIREGDLPAIVTAIVNAMTLMNKSGHVVGIDEKAGVLMLCEALGIEDPKELVEKMYPPKISGTPGRKGYNPDRTVVPVAAPIPKPQPIPGGEPQAPQGNPNVPPAVKPAEALRRLLEAARQIKKSA